MKYLLFLTFFFLISFSLAETCLTETCENYGESVQRGQLYYYCDFDSGTLCQQKSAGACLNDFECVSGYSCLSGTCTGSFSSLLVEYARVSSLLSGICYDNGLFCSNASGLNNATLLTNKNCSFKGNGFSCYQCKEGFNYNDTLGLCITGICEDTRGQFCSNVSVLNSSEEADYCGASKKCYSCDSDFYWNATLSKCLMESCVSSPGCINATDLANGHLVKNRLCNSGSCFTCNSSYKWNSDSFLCVLSSGGSFNGWTIVSFSSSDFNEGTYKLLRANDKVVFDFAGRTYYFGLFSADTKISFEINPVYNNQIMYSRDSRSYDLDNDGTYDLKVSLASIISGSANISLKRVSERYSNGNNYGGDIYDSDLNYSIETQTNIDDGIDLGSSTTTNSFSEKKMWIFIVLAIIFVVLLIVLVVYLMKHPKEFKKVDSGNNNSSTPIRPQPPVMPGNAPANYSVGGYRPMSRPTQQPNMQVR